MPYVQWMLAGSPLLFVYIIYTSILRGVGQYDPLLALALTSVIGLVITPILLKRLFWLTCSWDYCSSNRNDHGLCGYFDFRDLSK